MAKTFQLLAPRARAPWKTGAGLAWTLVLTLLSTLVGCLSEPSGLPPLRSSSAGEARAPGKSVVPAEWAPQESQWMGFWTHNYGTDERSLEALQLEMIEALTPSVFIDLVAPCQKDDEAALRALKAHGVELGRVRFHVIPYSDIWFRDHGPLFALDDEGQRSILDFGFDHWGYSTYGSESTRDDEAIDRIVGAALGEPIIRCSLVSEGGNVEVDGLGTAIVTESVVRRSNGQLSLEEIERELSRCYGLEQVIWLEQGMIEDDACDRGLLPGGVLGAGGTNGHADKFVRFAPDNKILLAQVRQADLNSPDPGARERAKINAERLGVSAKTLRRATDSRGRPFQLIRVPLASPSSFVVEPGDSLHEFLVKLSPLDDGTILQPDEPISLITASSYLNFVISNDVVLVPVYGSSPGSPPLQRRRDREVLGILGRAYPGRRIVPLHHGLAANRGGGGPHCMTQQMPVASDERLEP